MFNDSNIDFQLLKVATYKVINYYYAIYNYIEYTYKSVRVCLILYPL